MFFFFAPKRLYNIYIIIFPEQKSSSQMILVIQIQIDNISILPRLYMVTKSAPKNEDKNNIQ